MSSTDSTGNRPDDAAGPTSDRGRSRTRWVTLGFVIAAVLATLALSWWQWSRWDSASGTFQNLGYALQWPAFGLFFVWAYRQYLRYEKDVEDGTEAPAAPAARRARSGADTEVMREIPEDFLPPRPPIAPLADDGAAQPTRTRITHPHQPPEDQP